MYHLVMSHDDDDSHGSVRCTYNEYCWMREFVRDVVYHLVKSHDCDDSQNISGFAWRLDTLECGSLPNSRRI